MTYSGLTVQRTWWSNKITSCPYLLEKLCGVAALGRVVSTELCGGRLKKPELRVAVVIVTFNSGKYLSRCLTCLENQTVKPNKVVVVDNNSTDGSLENIEGRWPWVEFLHQEQNLGFVGANNLAIDKLNGFDWVALLNPDAFPKASWLETLLKAAEQCPTFTCFASHLLLPETDNTYLDGMGDVYHVSGRAWRRNHGREATGAHGTYEEVFSACAAAALYKRDDFLRVGGFDERYFNYFEDVDLGFRWRLAGYRCLYVPEAVVEHVGSGISGPCSDFTVYHGHRNLVWTYFKDMPWPLLWLYLPQHIVLNLVSVVAFAIRGQARVILRAKWDALKRLPEILKERRAVQARKRVGSLAVLRFMGRGWFTPYFRRPMGPQQRRRTLEPRQVDHLNSKEIGS